MTDNQKMQFRRWVRERWEQYGPNMIFHHGDCIGADAEAHDIVWALREEGIHFLIVIHPPTDERKRAFKGLNSEYVEIREPFTYQTRNRHIVYESAEIFAAPRTRQEVIRSGTWSVVRFARRQFVPIHIEEP
jgi:hypothetical protein